MCGPGHTLLSGLLVYPTSLRHNVVITTQGREQGDTSEGLNGKAVVEDVAIDYLWPST
jgi:hypothetical protein